VGAQKGKNKKTCTNADEGGPCLPGPSSARDGKMGGGKMKETFSKEGRGGEELPSTFIGR